MGMKTLCELFVQFMLLLRCLAISVTLDKEPCTPSLKWLERWEERNLLWHPSQSYTLNRLFIFLSLAIFSGQVKTFILIFLVQNNRIFQFYIEFDESFRKFHSFMLRWACNFKAGRTTRWINWRIYKDEYLDYVLSPAFFIVLSEHSILISCGKSRDMGNVPCSEHSFQPTARKFQVLNDSRNQYL